MTNKTSLGLVFGGNSSEYEVSIASAKNIFNAIDQEKFDIHPIWITNQGYIASEEDSFKVLEDPNYQVEPRESVSNLTNLIQLTNRPEIDVFFPIVHGNLGEDGVLQGLFRLLNKPFVGDDVLASAITMDKEMTKILAARAGVPVAKWVSVYNYEYADKNHDKLSYDYIAEKLGTHDMFVKPSNQGSSVGISHVTKESEYLPALAEAFKYDDKVLVEEAIDGTEVETAVLGNEDPQVSGVGQIINQKGTWYSYDNKYTNQSTTTLEIPAKLPDEIVEQVRSNALKVYRATECSGLARIDSMLRKSDNKVIFNELNALPGFTNISMYPKLFEETGISYSDLITKLIEFAQKRFDHKATLLHKHE
ncbi:MAG: D-alanine--D-alanine ligase family protein [Lactobacillus sp.]|nr:D-alanine--D-alanine ligase family protein [Lactobacillus sp.]